jgi:HK97 family phage prohead protease
MQDLLAQLAARQKTSPFPGSPGWARALDGKASFADPGAAQAGVDGSTASARFLITTSRKDRHGDVVMPEGCKEFLADYAANPVVFFGHDSSGLPIGSCKNEDGSLGLEFAEDGVYGRVKFHLKTLLSEQVLALTEAGELRGSSIGFLPKEAVLHKGNVEKLDDESNVIKFEPFFSFTFLKWALLEWSVVSVPANADALRCRLEKGVGGKALDGDLRRLLAPHVDPAKAWSPGMSFQPAAAGGTQDAGPATEGPAAPAAGGVTVESAKGEETPKRAPRKPGELYFVRSMQSIDRHKEYHLRSKEEMEHPGVVGHCEEAVGHLDKFRKKTQAKAEEIYPDVDFTMVPHTEMAAEVTHAATTPGPETSDLDLTAVESALSKLAEAQASVAKQLKYATGKV